MIDETLGKIEQRISRLDSLDPARKKELAELFETLRTEILQLSVTHAEQAESITRFAELSAHEATRGRVNPQLHDLSMQGLSASVEGFEVTHPRLVEIVNSICVVLSNLGI
jgi:hypothetical protein